MTTIIFHCMNLMTTVIILKKTSTWSYYYWYTYIFLKSFERNVRQTRFKYINHMMSGGAPHIGRWQGGCLDNIAKELSTILHSGFNFSKKKCNLEKLPQHAKVRREDLSLLLIWILQRNVALRHMLLLLMKNESIFALYFPFLARYVHECVCWYGFSFLFSAYSSFWSYHDLNNIHHFDDSSA